jgi:hypothetical protein
MLTVIVWLWLIPDIITQLKALKLHGMADCYAGLESEGVSGATASVEFTDAAQNVVLVASTRTGKTHLATALGVAGIAIHDKRVTAMCSLISSWLLHYWIGWHITAISLQPAMNLIILNKVVKLPKIASRRVRQNDRDL